MPLLKQSASSLVRIQRVEKGKFRKVVELEGSPWGHERRVSGGGGAFGSWAQH